MPRYLQAESVVRLTNVGKEELPKVIEDLGLNSNQAEKLQKLWMLRIHGRCERCESERGIHCVCPTTEKIDDNRRPLTVLGKLPHTTELMKIPCRKCGEQTPYTVSNALCRLEKKSDWDAFFRCLPCTNQGKEDRKAKRAFKRMKVSAKKARKAAEEAAKKAQADRTIAEKSARKAEEAKQTALRAEERVSAVVKELQAKNKASEPVPTKAVRKKRPKKKTAKKTKPLKPRGAPPQKRSAKPLTHKPFASLFGEGNFSQVGTTLDQQDRLG